MCVCPSLRLRRFAVARSRALRPGGSEVKAKAKVRVRVKVCAGRPCCSLLLLLLLAVLLAAHDAGGDAEGAGA